MSEARLQAAVIALAKACGYRVAHFRPAQTQRGRWITPMAGDVGWPDLILCGHKRLIVAELKSERGDLTEAQQEWLQELAWADVETYVWRPQLWHDGTIARCLGVKDGLIPIYQE